MRLTATIFIICITSFAVTATATLMEISAAAAAESKANYTTKTITTTTKTSSSDSSEMIRLQKRGLLQGYLSFSTGLAGAFIQPVVSLFQIARHPKTFFKNLAALLRHPGEAKKAIMSQAGNACKDKMKCVGALAGFIAMTVATMGVASYFSGGGQAANTVAQAGRVAATAATNAGTAAKGAAIVQGAGALGAGAAVKGAAAAVSFGSKLTKALTFIAKYPFNSIKDEVALILANPGYALFQGGKTLATVEQQTSQKASALYAFMALKKKLATNVEANPNLTPGQKRTLLRSITEAENLPVAPTA
jgi:hypothetical protein